MNQWSESHNKLEQSLRLNHELLKTISFGNARTAMRRNSALKGLHVALWVLCLIPLGGFLYANLGAPRFVLPGLALFLFAAGNLLALVHRIAAAQGIDYGQPVAAIQQQLESIRVMEIRQLRTSILAGATIWVALPIVLIKGLTGLDAYKFLSPAWIASNVLFGIAVSTLTWWVCRKYGHRLSGSPAVQHVIKSISGSSLNEAAAFVAGLAALELE